MALHAARFQDGSPAHPILNYEGGVLSEDMAGGVLTLGPFTNADGVFIHAWGDGPFYIRPDGTSPTLDDPKAKRIEGGVMDWIMFPAPGGTIKVIGASGAGKIQCIPLAAVRSH